MKKKFEEKQILISLLQNHLKKTKSKQKSAFETYSNEELIKCFYIYKLPLPVISQFQLIKMGGIDKNAPD